MRVPFVLLLNQCSAGLEIYNSNSWRRQLISIYQARKAMVAICPVRHDAHVVYMANSCLINGPSFTGISTGI